MDTDKGKREFLAKVKELEVADSITLANELEMTRGAARTRISRYVHRGLLEAMGVNDNRYCLSVTGETTLEYLNNIAREKING